MKIWKEKFHVEIMRLKIQTMDHQSDCFIKLNKNVNFFQLITTKVEKKKLCEADKTSRLWFKLLQRETETLILASDYNVSLLD
jgi:hypothetical protein